MIQLVDGHTYRVRTPDGYKFVRVNLRHWPLRRWLVTDLAGDTAMGEPQPETTRVLSEEEHAGLETWL